MSSLKPIYFQSISVGILDISLTSIISSPTTVSGSLDTACRSPPFAKVNDSRAWLVWTKHNYLIRRSTRYTSQICDTVVQAAVLPVCQKTSMSLPAGLEGCSW